MRVEPENVVGGRIIELDRKGEHIPVCTRQVFLKYYTDAASQQLHFWSAADRRAYLDAMRQALDRYLQSEEAEA